MIVYLAMLGVSLFLFYLVSPYKFNNKKSVIVQGGKITITRVGIATFFAAIPFLLVSGFRYSVGTDYWTTYYTGFYRILNNILFDRFEFGYYWLNRALQLFTENPYSIFVVTSLIFVSFTFLAIKQQSVNIGASIILLFFTRYFFISMNGIRQFIAAAIILYSLKHLLDKNYKKLIFYLFLAFSIHYTAIVFIPIYFLSKKAIEPRKFIRFSIGFIIVINALSQIVFYILRNTRFGQESRYSFAGSKFIAFTIALNLIIMFLYYENYYKNKNDKRYLLYLNIQVTATLVTFCLGSLQSMERVYWYYSFPLIVTFPYITAKSKRRWLVYLLYALIIIYFIYDIVYLNDHSALPYQTSLEKEFYKILWD